MKQTRNLDVAKMWAALGLVVEGQCECEQTRRAWNTVEDLEGSNTVNATLEHFHTWRIHTPE